MDVNSGLFGGLRASASGMAAERARIDVVAKNLANAQVTRTPDGSGPYRRQLVRFSTVMSNAFGKKAEPIGVKVDGVVSDMTSPLVRVHEPGHPDADADGIVTYPNIQTTAEMADLITAVRAYESNASAAESFVRIAERGLRLAQ